MKLLLLLGLLPLQIHAQDNPTSEIVNPKGNLYLGAEIGTNTITSFSHNGPDKSFQAGILAEYYFAKQWSVAGRIKYFETGVSFSKDSYSGAYFGQEGFAGIFKGAVIAIPVNIKWEYRVYKNLRGNLKLGLAYNYEIKSHYDFSYNLSTDHSKHFASLNSGIGMTYFLNKKLAVYFDYENYDWGGYKGNSKSLFSKNYYTENNLINLGIKYNFKK